MCGQAAFTITARPCVPAHWQHEAPAR